MKTMSQCYKLLSQSSKEEQLRYNLPHAVFACKREMFKRNK